MALQFKYTLLHLEMYNLEYRKRPFHYFRPKIGLVDRETRFIKLEADPMNNDSSGDIFFNFSGNCMRPFKNERFPATLVIKHHSIKFLVRILKLTVKAFSKHCKFFMASLFFYK